MDRRLKALIATTALLTLGAADVDPGIDPDNPTCPRYPNWSSNKKMELTPVDRKGRKILLAEGAVDTGLPDRLRKTLEKNPDIAEIWLRSPGGSARAGNEAGLLQRLQFRLHGRPGQDHRRRRPVHGSHVHDDQ